MAEHAASSGGQDAHRLSGSQGGLAGAPGANDHAASDLHGASQQPQADSSEDEDEDEDDGSLVFAGDGGRALATKQTAPEEDDLMALLGE